MTTLDDLMRELARIEPVPVGEYVYPCCRCIAERQAGAPPVAEGLWTITGLAEHEAAVHGEVRR